MKHIFCSFLSLSLIIFSQSASAAEYVNYNSTITINWVDADTQHFHHCSKGFYTGIKSNKRDSLCNTDNGVEWYFWDNLYDTASDNTIVYDHGGSNQTTRNGMHTCPYGFGIVAIEVTKKTGGYRFMNNFICKRITYGPVNIILDGGGYSYTGRSGMHACPIGYVMSGWKESKNQLECTKAI